MFTEGAALRQMTGYKNYLHPRLYLREILVLDWPTFFISGVAVLFFLHASVDGVVILSIQGPWWIAHKLPATEEIIILFRR